MCWGRNEEEKAVIREGEFLTGLDWPYRWTLEWTSWLCCHVPQSQRRQGKVQGGHQKVTAITMTTVHWWRELRVSGNRKWTRNKWLCNFDSIIFIHTHVFLRNNWNFDDLSTSGLLAITNQAAYSQQMCVNWKRYTFIFPACLPVGRPIGQLGPAL